MPFDWQTSNLHIFLIDLSLLRTLVVFLATQFFVFLDILDHFTGSTSQNNLMDIKHTCTGCLWNNAAFSRL